MSERLRSNVGEIFQIGNPPVRDFVIDDSEIIPEINLKTYSDKKEKEEILKKIRYMRRRHKGHKKTRTYQSIADELNLEGVKTRHEKKWSVGLVYNVLK